MFFTEDLKNLFFEKLLESDVDEANRFLMSVLKVDGKRIALFLNFFETKLKAFFRFFVKRNPSLI